MALPRSPVEGLLYVSKVNEHYYNQERYTHLNNGSASIIKEPKLEDVYHGYEESEIKSNSTHYSNYSSNNSSLEVNVTPAHNTKAKVDIDGNDGSISCTGHTVNDGSMSILGHNDDNLLPVVHSDEEKTKEDIIKKKPSQKKYQGSFCVHSFATINLKNQQECNDRSVRNLHKCAHCNMYFATKYRKMVHESRHGCNCRYVCASCGAGFNTPYKLKSHERIHTGQRPFWCKYCGERFTTKYRKNVHEVAHISDTPYECRYCDESFKSQYRCKQHELAHSNDKPYKCQFCHESFKSSHKRYIHTLTHSGISHPYQCPRCSDSSTSFRTAYRLRAHLATVHRLQPNEMRDLVQMASERDAFVLASASQLNYSHNVGAAHTRGSERKGGGGNGSPGLEYLRNMQDNEVVTCFSCNAQFGNKIGLISHIRVAKSVFDTR